MASRQYELTLHAVARLDRAIALLLSPDPPEPRGAVWTTERTVHVVDGLRAIRWLVSAGFEPPPQVARWLRARMEEEALEPGAMNADFHGAAVWYAADEVERLREEWRPEWSA